MLIIEPEGYMPLIDLEPFIAQGTPKSPTACPIALCLNDFFKDSPTFAFSEVRGNEIILYSKDGTTFNVRVDKAMARAVKEYDETGQWPRGSEYRVVAMVRGKEAEIVGADRVPEAGPSDYRREG